jgi:hypothetical protein
MRPVNNIIYLVGFVEYCAREDGSPEPGEDVELRDDTGEGNARPKRAGKGFPLSFCRLAMITRRYPRKSRGPGTTSSGQSSLQRRKTRGPWFVWWIHDTAKNG